MAPTVLKAEIRPSGERLTLTCEDASGRPLEILAITSNPTIRIGDGEPVHLSSPRFQEGETLAVEYALPDRVTPGLTVTLDAPAGWATTGSGNLPALASFTVKNLALVPVGDQGGSPARPTTQGGSAALLEVQKPLTLDLDSADVLASGRVLRLNFGSDTAPADLGTFVDWHRSKVDQLTLSGGRSSLEFAGCSVSRGQNGLYLFDRGANSTYSDSTNGETLTVWQGGTALGTIGPLSSASEVQTVTLANATGGTFTLTLNYVSDRITSALAYDASAADVQAALVTAIGSNWVTVTGNNGGPWTVTFLALLGSKPQLTAADATALTGSAPTVTIAQTQAGAYGRDLFHAAFLDILDAIPIPDTVPAVGWILNTPPGVSPSSPQTYKITVSDGTTAYTTAAITLTTQSGNNNQYAAMNALRTTLGYDGVFSRQQNTNKTALELHFEKAGCPIWPIRSVTLSEVSDPSMFTDVAEQRYLWNPFGNAIGFTVQFVNQLGCQDLDLSVTSSDPSSPLHGGLTRWRSGDARYRWAAYWYLRDPSEVVTFGESLTVSGPAGLLAGANEDGATGDTSAAFTSRAVANRSWAGPDGDLSPDLSHVTDAANGVDDGWSRWRSEAPPAAWIFSNPTSSSPSDQRPMRIAYIDPTYDGSHGTARLNDPTRPYTSLAACKTHLLGDHASNPTASLADQTPKLILIRKGTTAGSAGATQEGLGAFQGVSFEAPLIVSTYWMTADGAEPAAYATYQGGLTTSGANGAGDSVNYHDVILHGLEIRGSFQPSWLNRGAIWDCVFPPHADSYRWSNPLLLGTNMVDFAIVRVLIYDHWASGTNRISGIHSSGMIDFLIDQCSVLRCGYQQFGNYATYQSVLGSDVLASVNDAPYFSNLNHNIYLGEESGATPILLFNTYSMQGVYASFDCRPGSVAFGNCNYREVLGMQTIGDHCFSRRSSSHVRRCLNARQRGDKANWSLLTSTIAGNANAASLVSVSEDNLFLEPDTSMGGLPSNYAPTALGTFDLGSASTPSLIVWRHNLIVDQKLNVYSQESGSNTVPPSTFRMLIERNLVVRTRDQATPTSAFRMAALTVLDTFPGLTIRQNAYLATNTRTGDFGLSSGGSESAAGWAGWQADGHDADGLYTIQDFTTVKPHITGGRDVLPEYLATQSDAVTDATAALALIRDRRPGTWDHNLYAPLGSGPGQGLIDYAATAYRPTGLPVLGPAPNSYFGTFDYTVPPMRTQPPRITPQQLQRITPQQIQRPAGSRLRAR